MNPQKKLTLEELQVESFPVLPDSREERGTVKAYEPTIEAVPECFTRHPVTCVCLPSQYESCEDETCPLNLTCGADC